MKLLMPYITAGVTPNWVTYLTAFEDAGADLIEVGLPFSDPTVDGPTIQEASDAALSRGVTAASVLAELATVRVSIPLTVGLKLEPAPAPLCEDMDITSIVFSQCFSTLSGISCLSLLFTFPDLSPA